MILVLGAGIGIGFLGSRFCAQGAGLFLLRLRRRKDKPGSIKPGVRLGFLGMGADDLALKSGFDEIRYPAGVVDVGVGE